MKKSILLISVISFFAVFPVKAQMVIKNDGRVYVGPDTNPNDDSCRVLTMSIHGNGSSFAGSKLAFGDFGRYGHDGWNVFVGEYGSTDTDILWLHGKNGVKMTAQNSSYLLMQWQPSRTTLPRITFCDGLHVDRLSVSCDDRNKRSVTTIPYALPRLMSLTGIKYNYLPVDNRSDTEILEDCQTTRTPTEKEAEAMRQSAALRAAREQGDTRYGIMTSELARLFPEIVEQDDQGNQYVNYMELIPVMVSAIQELYSALESSGVTLGVMDEYEAYLRSYPSDSTAGGRQYANVPSGNPVLPSGAVLYQNSPNPFSSATVIEYYIPDSATTANLFIFTLNGELLETYPVTAFGHGSISIDGSTLDAGMYLYSLVVDEQIIDTKRMILTK
jgi:hypothetical protein